MLSSVGEFGVITPAKQWLLSTGRRKLNHDYDYDDDDYDDDDDDNVGSRLTCERVRVLVVSCLSSIVDLLQSFELTSLTNGHFKILPCRWKPRERVQLATSTTTTETNPTMMMKEDPLVVCAATVALTTTAERIAQRQAHFRFLLNSLIVG